MDNLQIQTAQNVTINQNLAGISKRILAEVIDVVFLSLFYFFLFYLLSKSGIDDKFFTWTFISVLTLPYFLYYPLLQYWNNGQTLGKQMVKIRVVKIDNSHPGIGDFLIRWIFRIFEIYMFPGLGIIVMLLSDKRQRLGDIAAKTTVISEEKKQKIDYSIFEDIDKSYQPTFPQVSYLKTKDIELIKNLFLEAKKLNNKRLINELSKKIQKTLKIEKSNYITDEEFIDKIIKDYNYYSLF